MENEMQLQAFLFEMEDYAFKLSTYFLVEKYCKRYVT